MEKYFIGLDKMSIDEIEIIRLLNRHSNYETNVAGYTINQLVVNSDKRLGLTTQKVRTILKKLEKEGYIKFLTSGSKGKESTLLLTIKQQLFSNKETDKDKDLQGAEDLNNNKPTTKKQLSSNTTKKKENNNIIDAYTQNPNLKEAINDFISMRNKIKKPLTDRALKGILNKLDTFTNNDFEKILILEQSIEHCWLSVFELKNKKGPTAIGPKRNNSSNNSICGNENKYTRGVEIL